MPVFLKEDELNNEAERMKFKYWQLKNYKPSLRLVAEEIGINYSTLRNFSNGYHDLNENNLKLVHDFLNEKLGRKNTYTVDTTEEGGQR